MFDHHIANSRYTAEELVAASEGHTTRRGIWVCPMGVDAESLPFLEHRPHTPVRLLYAGRLSREKNALMLVDVLERLPNGGYELWIAGDGPLAGHLRGYADARTPKRVRMLGHLGSRGELAELYRNCDVFVHPNPREPFGIAPLEAMACGLPVVAPNAGGVLSYASEANAWLAEATPEAFARMIRTVYLPGGGYERRAAAARATAERHSWPLIAERFFRLCDELHTLGFQIAEPPLGAAIDAWQAAQAAEARAR
jgi:glycosyltransferase involved in cell wall biosynthesis